MARRRWSEWASARMLRALVREGARVHAAAGVRTVAPPVFFSARGWKRVSKKRVRGRGSCILRPIPRVTTPRIKLTYCICFSAKSLKHVRVFTRLDKMKESCSEPHI